ncbi:hypothetical protein F6U93_03085 [Tamlana haliotis]|uniref:Uncharacterized protein n=1 Tax=Pseudotamlana haliotis TaxID=2614804 RepID=A0A6N6MIK4_9FLAO|nr:hypothetical protein [Tamlana haliotis]KAB1069810.1 hypothetical protein F6U93_03085 [Tamlana haliotis]
MMQYAEASEKPFMNVLVTHKDKEREYVYASDQTDTSLKALTETSQKKNWVNIDMKNDWKVVYPFQLNTNTTKN